METPMENQENVVIEDQERTVIEATPVAEQKPKKKKTWLFILIGVFLLATVLVLGWLCYKNGCFETEQMVVVEEEIEEEEDVEEQVEETEQQATTLRTYNGSFFSTQHPAGWRIVEYLDGEGSSMLFEEEQYTGLTGLKIFLGTREIFSLEGVTGIGFVGCPELAKFSDSNPAYEQEQMDMNLDVMMDMEFLDYTNTTFSSFRWFDKDFRRVGRYLFYDTVPNNQYFEPQCEIGFLPINQFTYTDTYGYESNAYLYNMDEQVTEEELKILDSILENMVKK